MSTLGLSTNQIATICNNATTRNDHHSIIPLTPDPPLVHNAAATTSAQTGRFTVQPQSVFTLAAQMS